MDNKTYGINEHGEYSGFYYDIQKLKPDTSITLHANTELKYDNATRPDPKSNKSPEWVEWGLGGFNSLSWRLAMLKSRIIGKKVKPTRYLLPITFPKNGKEPINWSARYGVDPIATAILNEDFLISVNNTWTDTAGNNNIEDFWRSIQLMAPMLRNIIAGVVLEEADKLFGTSLNPKALTVAHYLNKALVVLGNRFSMYLGTNTDFTNLSIKFTIFSDWVIDDSGKGNAWVFKSCTDKLKDLYPYFQGWYSYTSALDLRDYYNLIAKGVDKFGKDLDSSIIAWISEKMNKVDGVLKLAVNSASESLAGMFGFLDPPAGYELTTNKNIDNCQKGTFRLVFGGRYAIENLVGTSMQVSLSKTSIKAPNLGGTKDLNEIIFCPQYADVTLNFKCASSYSNHVMESFIEQEGSVLAMNINANQSQIKKEIEAAKLKENKELFELLEYVHKHSNGQ